MDIKLTKSFFHKNWYLNLPQSELVRMIHSTDASVLIKDRKLKYVCNKIYLKMIQNRFILRQMWFLIRHKGEFPESLINETTSATFSTFSVYISLRAPNENCILTIFQSS